MIDPPKTPARILLVEDYDDARDMYAEALEFAGHAFSTARDGQEALDLLSKAVFDLGILDMALSKVDGLTVIKTLRAQDATRLVPIVSLSASVGTGMHKTILAAGADLALDKPCLPDELDTAVRECLGRATRVAADPAE